jgi:hypothetical protein
MASMNASSASMQPVKAIMAHIAMGKSDDLWSPSSFAASCGGGPLDIIAAYIRAQRE